MNLLSQGEGALFGDPSSNRARQFFAGKPRALTDKVMTVREAVSRFVHDGDYFASGGFGCSRIATAVLHEIHASSHRHLSAIGYSLDLADSRQPN